MQEEEKAFETWYKESVDSYLAMAKKTKDSVDSQVANDFIESYADLKEAFIEGYKYGQASLRSY